MLGPNCHFYTPPKKISATLFGGLLTEQAAQQDFSHMHLHRVWLMAQSKHASMTWKSSRSVNESDTAWWEGSCNLLINNLLINTACAHCWWSWAGSPCLAIFTMHSPVNNKAKWSLPEQVTTPVLSLNLDTVSLHRPYSATKPTHSRLDSFPTAIFPLLKLFDTSGNALPTEPDSGTVELPPVWVSIQKGIYSPNQAYNLGFGGNSCAHLS